jgi:3-deoxy-D-manno-octulosonic-acid transferase
MMVSVMTSAPWRWRVALGLYRLLSPLLLIVALPAWLRKMAARGGWSTPFGQRFGCYDEDIEWAPSGRMHMHAVSVGETLIALKFLRAWHKEHPQPVVLAVSTATAYHLALAARSELLTIVYAPLDLVFFVSAYLRRFEPAQVVLVEAEAWPELMEQCQRKKIPVCMINARLSARSERRYRKVRRWIAPLFQSLRHIGVQDAADAARFASLGIAAERMTVTGSIKFDPEAAPPPRQRPEFSTILAPIRKDRALILAASTHDGEELLLAHALRDTGTLFLCVPRHAERRNEVRDTLQTRGFTVWLRSEGIPPNEQNIDVLIIDSTGELRDWTAHADVVIIGKSFLSTGGQNPAEAILAAKPVIVGPHMENFEPLVGQLIAAHGIIRINNCDLLAHTIATLRQDRGKTAEMCEHALHVLQQHAGATARSITMLENSIALTRACNNSHGIEHTDRQTETKTEPGP